MSLGFDLQTGRRIISGIGFEPPGGTWRLYASMQCIMVEKIINGYACGRTNRVYEHECEQADSFFQLWIVVANCVIREIFQREIL